MSDTFLFQFSPYLYVIKLRAHKKCKFSLDRRPTLVI